MATADKGTTPVASKDEDKGVGFAHVRRLLDTVHSKISFRAFSRAADTDRRTGNSSRKVARNLLECCAGYVMMMTMMMMMVPEYMAGIDNVIGSKGRSITSIAQESKCELKVSANGKFFPGFQDRIAIMGA